MAELETLQDATADVIIIDTGAGIRRNVLAFAAPADHITVVTTPEPTAITDAYAVIKVLMRSGTATARSASSSTRCGTATRHAYRNERIGGRDATVS